MQTVSCPSCGAPVEFKSHASVMAVCEYCHATVLKDADAVRDIGKMSSVLEDYSPIQIGSSGTAGGRQFNVIGRIQLRYSAGMWNEWYLMFDDGATGWLGDSSGLFTLTTEIPAEGGLPDFDSIHPGRRYDLAGQRFTASEKRVARCVGGQGELPFKVGEGWEAKVADFRAGPRFVTLDYSDERPVLYNGFSVTLEQMQMQLLRDEEQIKASAGKYRGKLDTLDCPSCGSLINYLPGITTTLLCPSCATRLDAAGPEASVLDKGEQVERVRTTLVLGSKATINNREHTVLGAMVRADDEGTTWTEYLLYSPRGGFFWLVEAEEWWRADVQYNWPDWSSTGSGTATLDGATYRKLYDYPATVRWAAGAFNWRVQVGDVVRVYEFEHAQTRLSAEMTDDELTWSRSTRVAFDQVRAWFGQSMRNAAIRTRSTPANQLSPSSVRGFMIALFFFNILPAILSPRSMIYPLIGALAIWLPARLMKGSDEDQP